MLFLKNKSHCGHSGFFVVVVVLYCLFVFFSNRIVTMTYRKLDICLYLLIKISASQL